jgi:hypothetical protein
MSNVLDQETVFQEFNDIVPAEIVAPLRPHIAGGHAELRRYSDSTEKSLCLLGDYDAASETVYNWPNRSAGSIVDLSYVSLTIEDALLRYYQDEIGSGDGTVTAVAGFKNRIITSASRGFLTNTATYPRLASLYDRDVAPGDVVRLRVGGTVFDTSVVELIPSVVAASIGSASSDAANSVSQPNNQLGTAPTVDPTGGGGSGGSLQAGVYFIQYTFVGPFGETWGSAGHTGASPVTFTVGAGEIPRVTLPALPTGATSIKIYLTQAGEAAGTETLYASGITTTTHDLTAATTTGTAAVPTSISQTDGTENNVAATALCASYRGDAVGDISETYTIVCTQASTGGDATTALLKVTSASGRDDVASVTPAAFASPTTIGTRGVTVTWTTSASNNFVVGQTWQITARQAFVAPSGTSAGTYVGEEIDETFDYVITVTRGGYYADSEKPQITVTRSDGGDTSGPTNVTGHTTAIAVGVNGVTLSFSNNGSNPGLRKGDIYYVGVTSSKYGHYKTLVLNHNLSTTFTDAADIELNLCIRKDITVPVNRLSDPPTTNWTAEADTITVADAIDAYDSTLTDGGVEFAVPVIAGQVYATYRAWLDTKANNVFTYTPSSTDIDEVKAEVEAILGTVDPDNPLAYGVWKAALNSNEQPVLYTAIADPDDTDEWQDNLDNLKGYKNIYGLVPLTNNATVLNNYVEHVEARSEDEIGGEWRVAWFAFQADTSSVIVDATTTSDGAVATATLADNPLVSGTQYTQLNCATANAFFVTNGVAAGDIVRFLYTQDAFGTTTYSEFTVQSVTNEDSLILSSGHVAAVTTAQRFEIWRNLRKSEIASNLAAQATAVGNKRVRYVWPDQIEDGDLTVDGYFVAAAFAGMTSGIAPHQGLRNVQLRGFDGVSRSTSFFNNAQLTTLADAGCFVVTIDSEGFVYARDARTTDTTDVDSREEMVVRNDDALRHLMYSRVASYFGKANTSNESLILIRGALQSAQELAKNSTRISRIGSMVEDTTLTAIRRHSTIPDRIVIQLTSTRPYPANDATVTLVL